MMKTEPKWMMHARYGTQMPVFRKEFVVHEKPTFAEIKICGLGSYALFFQESEVNAGQLEPGWTDYSKTCLYRTYNVQPLIECGKNRITVLLGNGMYHIEPQRYRKFQSSFGDPCVWAELVMRFADGATQTILTDPSWSCTAGPVLFSSIYGGEDFDGRVDHWLAAIDGNPALWEPVLCGAGPGGACMPALQPPVTIQKHCRPVAKTTLKNGNVVFDFGTNMAGCPQIRVEGPRGEAVRMTPGELLHADGSVDQTFSGAPHHYNYILSGGKSEIWRPRFTYYGFRYVEVSGAEHIQEIMGLAQAAACEQSGMFLCSLPLYNQIHHLILQAMKSNMQSVLTDCPHREKLGWLEQSHLMCDGLLYNFQIRGLLEKILEDMRQAQTEQGLIPNICPEYVQFDGPFRDSAEWGSAGILLPWRMFQWFGDLEILRKNYAMAANYGKYLLGKTENGILTTGLGDWLDVGSEDGFSNRTPPSVPATAILYEDLRILLEMANCLQETDDVIFWSREKARIKNAFQQHFLRNPDGNCATGSQACNGITLALHLVEEDKRADMLKNLLLDIQKENMHFTGGDIGHPYTVRALADSGCNQVIADVFAETTYPGYGYQLSCGATTLCEMWNGPDPKNPKLSQNHFMLGIAEEWFYSKLAGVQISSDMRGNLTVVLAPFIPKQVHWVTCAVETTRGMVRIHWEKSEQAVEQGSGAVQLDMVTPKGVKARLLWNGEGVELPGGTYSLTKEWN